MDAVQLKKTLSAIHQEQAEVLAELTPAQRADVELAREFLSRCRTGGVGVMMYLHGETYSVLRVPESGEVLFVNEADFADIQTALMMGEEVEGL